MHYFAHFMNLHLRRFHWPCFQSLPHSLATHDTEIFSFMVATKSAHMKNSCLPGRLPELALRPGGGIVTMSKHSAFEGNFLKYLLSCSCLNTSEALNIRSCGHCRCVFLTHFVGDAAFCTLETASKWRHPLASMAKSKPQDMWKSSRGLAI